MYTKTEVKVEKQETKKTSKFVISIVIAVGFFAWSYVTSMPQLKQIIGG